PVLELVLLLDAARDVEEPLGGYVSHVPGAEAVILHQHRRVLLGTVVISLHHVGTANDDLAMQRVTGDRAVELHRVTRARLADGAHLARAGVVGRRDGARLGEAVALVPGDPERVDEVRHLRTQRRAAADRILEPPAEALSDGGEDET